MMISQNDWNRIATKVKTARVALMHACMDVDAVHDDDDDPALESASDYLSRAFLLVRSAEDRVSSAEVK